MKITWSRGRYNYYSSRYVGPSSFRLETKKVQVAFFPVHWWPLFHHKDHLIWMLYLGPVVFYYLKVPRPWPLPSPQVKF